MRLDGKPIAKFTLSQIRRLLRADVGTIIHATIQRDGKTGEVSFALKELSGEDSRVK